MKNKTVLITGATSGIGFETAVALAGKGARIVFTTRDAARGVETQQRIISRSGNHEVFPMFCRLDDFQSIRDFAKNFTAQHASLDVLINNAGIWETVRKESVNGIEMTFAVNYLAPFLLTLLLLPQLEKSAPSRIINVSSQAYQTAKINFEDPEFKQSYPWMEAYTQSKLANMLFTTLLAKKMISFGITVNCLHPGVVLTPIYRNMNPFLRAFFRLYMIRPAKGAQTTVYLASSPEIQHLTGAYFVKNKQAEILPHAKDPETAEQLWNLGMKYISPWLSGNPI